MNADGSNLVNVTNTGYNELVHESTPSWSPAGARVAYSAVVDMSLVPEGDVVFTSGASSIFSSLVYGACGRVTVPYVDAVLEGGSPVDPSVVEFSHDAWDDSPAWSPDGETLAFVRDVSDSSPAGQSSRIYVVSPDVGWCIWDDQMQANRGATPTLVGEGGWDATGLEWSPDASSLLFAEASSDGFRSTLRRLDVATGAVSDIVPLLGFSHYKGPALSADGLYVAFEASDGDLDPGDIYVWPADGTAAPRRLTVSPAADSDPAWQPWSPPIGFFDARSGVWELREGTTEAHFFYGNPGDSPFMGDWDCDGVDTPGLYRRSVAFVYLRNTNTQGIADISFYFGNPGDVPIAGDFDGDGCDTVSIYRPSEARFYIMNTLGENEGGLGVAEDSFLFGNPGDKPVVGDWDGDGIDEIGLHRETTGLFYYRNTLTTGVADGLLYFGEQDDRFIAGDWGLADGVETPAMYRPSNTTFYFRHTLTQGNADSQIIWDGPGPNPLPVSGVFTLD